jgi:long-subunit acyl-CoA synthetase (AMP-forming)
VIEGLMQHEHPLTILRLVERCETVNASASCITAAVEKPRLETSLGVVAGRAHRVAHALASLGVQEGDRVAVVAGGSARARVPDGAPLDRRGRRRGEERMARDELVRRRIRRHDGDHGADWASRI